MAEANSQWPTPPSASGAAMTATGKLVDYTAEVSEGMVVLDAVHQIQATQANDLACRWNCKAGKCGSCSAEINGMPKLMCMTRLRRSRPEPAGHHRADAGVSAHPRPGDRCLLEFPREETDQAIQAAQARRRRRHLDAWPRKTSTACRNSASASNVFCARTSATFCATTISTTNSSARVFSFTPPRWKCIRWTPKTACRNLSSRRASAMQHHQVLHQSLPGDISHHRQRDHSAEGTRGRPLLRSREKAVPDFQRQGKLIFSMRERRVAGKRRPFRISVHNYEPSARSGWYPPVRS